MLLTYRFNFSTDIKLIATLLNVPRLVSSHAQAISESLAFLLLIPMHNLVGTPGHGRCEVTAWKSDAVEKLLARDSESESSDGSASTLRRTDFPGIRGFHSWIHISEIASQISIVALSDKISNISLQRDSNRRE